MDKDKIELCIKDKDDNDAVVAWIAGYSDAELNALLRRHPSWYRSYEEMT